jgi:hypothetical protein
MKLDESYDFGFSLVSEDELKQEENILKQQISEVELSAKDKLFGLRDMIMPLLINLSKDPEKTHILWPNRVEKINEFIDRINSYVGSEND